MPLKPPTNQFESLSVWLKEFNKTVATIIRGFSLEPYVTNQFQSVIPTEKGKSNASGIYTDGEYWLGFYYKLRNEPRVALPWFGCEFVDKFNISIIVHKTVEVAGTSNNALHQHHFIK